MTLEHHAHRFRKLSMYLRFPILLVAILAGLEFSFRQAATADTALVPRIYYSRNTAIRPPHYVRQVSTPAGVDVIFIGSSIVQTDIDPRLFDRVTAVEHGLDITSFNCGLAGAGLDTTRLFLDNLWLERGRPTVVVHGMRLWEMLASQEKESEWQDAKFDRRGIERMWMSTSVLTHVRSALTARFMLLQYPGLVPEFLSVLREGQRVSTMLTDATREDDGRGFFSRPETINVKLAKGQKVAGKHRYDPVKHAGEYPRAKRKIREIKEICDDRGALYLVVNIQEHPFKYSRPGAEALYVHYLDTLRDYSREMEFRFVDPTDGDPRWMESDRFFNDYHHMTTEGAEILTPKLANEIFDGWTEGHRAVVRSD